MELTQECIEIIVLAAREAENGKLVITVQSRPEDNLTFDMKCEYEKKIRVNRVLTKGEAGNKPKGRYST